MLYLESFDKLLDVLKVAASEEDCKHASYISNTNDIAMLMETINKNTNAIPEFINFNNFIGEECNYYSLSLDYGEGELKYSITPAIDEKGKFYPDFGLCLVDECVPDAFETDYKRGYSFNENYESPIRIYWGEEPEEDDEDDEDCKRCTVNCDASCCKKNEIGEAEEKTRIDTDDKGRVQGFTKSWKDKNSFFKYSYYSTNEEDVLDFMRKFRIGHSE